jgi:hypothetical protein
MRITRRVCLLASTTFGLDLLASRLCAQPPKSSVRTARAFDDVAAQAPETDVTIELISGAAAAAEHAQAWGQRLQQLEISFQTRQAVAGDKPQIKEKKLGRLRRVTVTAVLDRNGKILCSDRNFTLAESDKLAEWIRELKAYGAQGAPQGRPRFGLDDRQFAAVLKALTPKADVDTQGLTLESVLGKLPLPETFPLRMTPEARKAAKALDPEKALRQSVRGLSVGTALAATLGEFGLAFRPLRTPGGSIELAVSPRSEDSDHWPIGWPLDPDKPQGQLVPNLFKMVPVNLEDVPLPDVLAAAAKASEVPIVIDYHAIDEQHIDLTELKVNVPSRKTTWGLLLKQVTFPHKLGRRIVTDESNRPLVLITTLKESLKNNPAAKTEK